LDQENRIKSREFFTPNPSKKSTWKYYCWQWNVCLWGYWQFGKLP